MKTDKLFRFWFAFLFLLIFVFGIKFEVFAQATEGTTDAVTCPADGSSIEIVPASAKRKAIAILNDSATDIRVGYLDTGTADLDDTNSYVQKSGVNIADSVPGVYLGRIVCMSTTASSVVIHYIHTTR